MNLPKAVAPVTLRQRGRRRTGWECCLPKSWRELFQEHRYLRPIYMNDADPPHIALSTLPGRSVADRTRPLVRVSLPGDGGPRLRWLYSPEMATFVWEAGLKHRQSSELQRPVKLLAMLYKGGVLILSAPTDSEGTDIALSLPRDAVSDDLPGELEEQDDGSPDLYEV